MVKVVRLPGSTCSLAIMLALSVSVPIACSSESANVIWIADLNEAVSLHRLLFVFFQVRCANKEESMPHLTQSKRFKLGFNLHDTCKLAFRFRQACTNSERHNRARTLVEFLKLCRHRNVIRDTQLSGHTTGSHRPVLSVQSG
jgi:hypothetical protein